MGIPEWDIRWEAGTTHSLPKVELKKEVRVGEHGTRAVSRKGGGPFRPISLAETQWPTKKRERTTTISFPMPSFRAFLGSKSTSLIVLVWTNSQDRWQCLRTVNDVWAPRWSPNEITIESLENISSCLQRPYWFQWWRTPDDRNIYPNKSSAACFTWYGRLEITNDWSWVSWSDWHRDDCAMARRLFTPSVLSACILSLGASFPLEEMIPIHPIGMEASGPPY